jgi:hypothetical protein
MDAHTRAEIERIMRRAEEMGLSASRVARALRYEDQASGGNAGTGPSARRFARLLSRRSQASGASAR